MNIADVSKDVAKKHKLVPQDVERFVTKMFEVVNKGLDADKLVKVKGLGTFKVTAVKERESVNVNTGERVLISGHEKITFTPDAIMKDLVNKPFSQFETVVLNDDVDFSEVDEAQPTEEQEQVDVDSEAGDVSEESLSVVTEEVQELPEEVPSETEAPEEEHSVPTASSPIETEQPVSPAMEELPIETQPVEDLPAQEEKTTEETVSAQDEVHGQPADHVGDEEPAHEAVVIPLMSETAPVESESKSSVPVVEAPKESEGQQVAQTEQVQSETNTVPPVSDTERDVTEEEPTGTSHVMKMILVCALVALAAFGIGFWMGRATGDTAGEKPVEKPVAMTDSVSHDSISSAAPAPKAQETVDLDQLNDDPRVKLGAYRIEGIDTVITLEKGQTMDSYCRTRGGGSGFLGYYQVVNGADELGEGQQMKVPKLMLKKRK